MAVDVGSAIGYLDLDIRGFLDGLRTANAEAENSLKKTENAAQKWQKVSEKTLSIGKDMTKYITTPVIAGVTLVGKYFGDLEQNLGGTEYVFGRFATQIQNAANEAYKNMGTSASNYMATANKMASLFQGSGLTQQRSLQLTMDAMQRAADVASIMGISTSSALEAVTAAAKGNFTMMDNLGVAMNATTLSAYALEKGVNFKWETATNAQKAELAMEMFFEKTTQYAGNFARESTDTLTGSFGKFKAATEDLIAGIGQPGADINRLKQNFTDAFNDVVSNVSVLLGTIWENIPVPDWAKYAVLVTIGLGPVLTAVGTVSGAVTKTIEAYNKIKDTISLASIASWSLPILGIAAAVAVAIIAITNLDRHYKTFFEDSIKAKEAKDNLLAAMESADKDFEGVESKIVTATIAAGDYMARLEELDRKTRLSTAEQAEYAAIVEKIKALIPGLNVEINEQTGKIEGGTKALRDNIQAWKDSALSKALIEKQEKQVSALADAHIALYEAQQKYVKNQEDIASAQAAQKQAWEDLETALNDAGYTLDQYINRTIDPEWLYTYVAGVREAATAYEENTYQVAELEKKNEALKTSADELKVAYDEANASFDETVISVNNLKPAAESASEAMDAVAEATDAFAKKIEEGFAKVIEDASKNVINNFEEIKLNAEINLDELAKILDKNVATFDATMGAMASLANKGVNEGVLAYLYDMGVEGWSIINKMDLATVDQMKRFEKSMLDGGVGATGAFEGAMNRLPPEVKAIMAGVKGDMEDVGEQIPAGVSAGASRGEGGLLSRMRAMASNAVAAARAALSINSPSDVFADDVGHWLPFGVAKGVTEAMPTAMRNIESTINSGVDKINLDPLPDVELPTVEVNDFASRIKESYGDVLNWFKKVETGANASIDSMSSKLQSLVVMGNNVRFAAAGGYSFGPARPGYSTNQIVTQPSVNVNIENMTLGSGVTASMAEEIGKVIGDNADRELRSRGYNF